MASQSKSAIGGSAARIAELLGLPGPELPTRSPVRSLRAFGAACAGPALAQVLPAELSRRRSREFDPEQSQQLYRLAGVWLTALGVFKEPIRNRSFLASPHAMLRGISPLQCAASKADLRQVESVLGRLQNGSAAKNNCCKLAPFAGQS